MSGPRVTPSAAAVPVASGAGLTGGVTGTGGRGVAGTGRVALSPDGGRVGAGPLVTGILSDYFAKTHGTDGLRWALSGVTCMFLFTVLFFVLAINPYKQRLQQMKSA